MEGGEDVKGNELGFLGEGEGEQVVECFGEEGGGGEEGGEAALVTQGFNGDGVGEIGELGRG